MGFLDSVRTAMPLFSALGYTRKRNGHRVAVYDAVYTAFEWKNRLKGYGINANGLENIQPAGSEPRWIASKHMDGRDIPDLSYAIKKQTGKAPYFVARDDLPENDWEMEQYLELGAIFINRQSPSIKTLRDIVEKAAEGNTIVVFPEGTRDYGREVGPFNQGLAMMADRLYREHGINAPIYCTGIIRPENPGKGVTINISARMYMSDYRNLERKDRRNAATAVMKHTVGLLCSEEGYETSRMCRWEFLRKVIGRSRLILSAAASASKAGSRLILNPGSTRTSSGPELSHI